MKEYKIKMDIEADTYGFHPSLLIPIAEKNKSAIERYVGKTDKFLKNNNGVLVSFKPLAKPNNFRVWQHERSGLLNCEKQLWVNINFTNYREQYKNYFEDKVKKNDYVVNHIMNRKLAEILGYKYVRLLHISRGSNSSGGRGGETYGNKYVNRSKSWNPCAGKSDIVYADPMDLLKMLDMKVGGFPLDFVRDKQHIFYSE